MGGPLSGFRIIEMVGIGPGPFASMMLSDMGAEVLRVDRVEAAGTPKDPVGDFMARGRRSACVDLKHPQGAGVVLRLVERADALIEGFRPGVAERLGIGPDACLERNARLVYGRMTGWGQSGPYAAAPGHDINYIALAGALDPLGRAGGPPVPPLNLLGDFGGGGMLMAFGLVCALLESSRSGRGQVVDAAMVDGAAVLTTFVHSLKSMGMWPGGRGQNLLDTGAPFYDVHETADGKYVAVGALEPKFYAEMLRLTGLDEEDLPAQMDRARWPEIRRRMAEVFRSKTRDEWCEIMEGTESCFAPVLALDEAPSHPHIRERATFIEVGGRTQPAPAPRFSRTPPQPPGPPERAGENTEEALRAWGLTSQEVGVLRETGAVV